MTAPCGIDAYLFLFLSEALLGVLQLSLLPLQFLCSFLQDLFLRHSHGVLHLDLPHQCLQIPLELFDDAVRLRNYVCETTGLKIEIIDLKSMQTLMSSSDRDFTVASSLLI